MSGIDENYFDGIDKNYGLHGMVPDKGILSYVNMTDEEVRRLTAERCAEISYLLSSYALFLQKEENKYNMLYTRIKASLDEIVFKEITNYCSDPKYVKYEEKVAMVCAENAPAREFRNSLVEFESRRNYLTFLSKSVYNISTALNELRRSKYEYKNR